MKHAMSPTLKYKVWDGAKNAWLHDGTPDAVHLFGETIVFGELLRRPNDSMMPLDDMSQLVALPYTGYNDRHGNPVFAGDIVRVVTERLSSSAWYQKTNQNHGDVTLDMYVVWDSYHAGYGLVICDPSERREKERPIGQERQSQHIHLPHAMYDRSCVARGEVIGNIYPNPEMVKHG